jgi:CHC2 zinc finger/Toprim domain
MSLSEFFSAHSRAPVRATIPQSAVDLARSRDLLEIATQHTRLTRVSPAEYVGPCPACGGKDRFAVHVKKQVFNCRGCGAKGGDAIALVQFVNVASFPEAVSVLTDGQSTEPLARKPQRETVMRQPAYESDRAANALKVWDSSIPITGTPAEFYLGTRALHPDFEGLSGVLRYHPKLWHPRGWSQGMVALFREIKTDEPRAISRTFLDENGYKFDRRFLGPVKDCAIKLDPVGDELYVGEGIETCLTAMHVGLRPVWALGSAGAISRFPLLDGVKTLHLLRERDQTNAGCAQFLGRYYRQEGRKVMNIWPRPRTCNDLNDALRMQARDVQ